MKRSSSGIGSTSRRAAILVFVMIGLLLVSMISASLLRTSLASIQQIRREQNHLQAEFIADAGCQRALVRVRANAEYKGEDWIVSSDEATKDLPVTVHITIEPVADSDQRIVTAIATYPQQSSQQIRVTRRLLVPSKNVQ